MKRVLLPATAKVSEQDKRVELFNGSIIEFWSLDGDPEACRGRKYHRVIINEAAKARHLKTAWELAIRPTLTDYKGDAILTSTPRGRDFYHELFERFLDGLRWPGWMSWKKPTVSNPHIDPDEVAQAKLELPSTVYLQEYEAEFLDVAGKFFDEWEPEREFVETIDDDGNPVLTREPWHVVEPFRIPAHWDVWGSVDYGTSTVNKTFAFLLLASDEQGGVVVVDEIYESGKQAGEQAQLILNLLRKHGVAWPVDIQHANDGLWETRLKFITMDYASTFPPENVEEQKGKYPVEYYWERGLPCVRAVKGRVAGWNEIKQWLHDTVNIKRADDGSLDVRAKLRVFRGACSELIRTLPQLVRSSKNPEDIHGENQNSQEEEHKQEDHLADALRYGMMTRPGMSHAPKENAAKKYREGKLPDLAKIHDFFKPAGKAQAGVRE